MKKRLFPVYVNDVYLSYPSDLTVLLKFNSVNIDTKNISKNAIEYLIKHKKFMDSESVYSMAMECEVELMNFVIKDIIQSNVPGDFVETGVWRGGMGIWMNYLNHHYAKEPRKMWLFDSYDEFPEPKCEKDRYVHPVTRILYEKKTTIEDVKKNFEDFGLLTTNLCFVKGKFEKSIPNVDIPQISLLHIDSDYYDPTLLTLEKYYRQIVQNGYVIVNNYYYEYVNAKQAVDEFRERNKINNPIIKIGERCGYWRV